MAFNASDIIHGNVDDRGMMAIVHGGDLCMPLKNMHS